MGHDIKAYVGTILPPDLVDACSQVARQMGLTNARPHALPGPTDGLAFLARGISAITVVGFADGQRLPNYHTMSETTRTIDFHAACPGTKFAMALAWKLAQAV